MDLTVVFSLDSKEKKSSQKVFKLFLKSFFPQNKTILIFKEEDFSKLDIQREGFLYISHSKKTEKLVYRLIRQR